MEAVPLAQLASISLFGLTRRYPKQWGQHVSEMDVRFAELGKMGGATFIRVLHLSEDLSRRYRSVGDLLSPLKRCVDHHRILR